MSNSRPLSLKKMLLLVFLLAGLLPALLISALSFYQARQALRIEIRHDLHTTGEAVAGHIARIMRERTQNVQSWSQLAVMQDLQIGDIDKRLSVFLHETHRSYASEYLALDVVDLQGHIVASSDARRIGQTLLLPAPWAQWQQNGQVMQLHPVNSMRMPMSAPIISANDGQVAGSLVVSFNWQVIFNLLEQAAQHSTELALLDGQDHMLAHSSNWSSQQQSVRIHAKLQGQTPWSGWTIQLNKDYAVAVAPVHRLGGIFLLLLLVIVLISVLLVQPLAQSINQPLLALTHYVQQIRQPVASEPEPRGPLEVRQLQQAFTTMRNELLAYEQQLTQAAKLAVVGEMAAAMSHEVRTPLGILRSSAEILLREPALTPDGVEVLGFIISETERLNKLVSGLIDAARPRPLNKLPVDLLSHIRHVLALLAKQAESKHITLSVTEPVSPVQVSADPDQLTQVLLNLILNAIQILPSQGHVAIHLEQQMGFACIAVADNGPGVPESQQQQLFDTFFSHRAGGIGLGLAVVKQIVEAHGGKISYSRSAWQGAQFNIQLPL